MTDSDNTPLTAPNPLLDVTDEEWKAAQAFFLNPKNKDEVKFRRKDNEGQLRSFIKVGNEVFVMASKLAVGPERDNYSELGKGGFGKVKVVQNRVGENFAVKVEKRTKNEHEDLTERDAQEMEVMKLIDQVKGRKERRLGFISQEFSSEFNTLKLYTVIKLQKGKDLNKVIYFSSDKMEIEDEQKLEIALKACEAIQALHDKRIIHADLKPANLMVNIEGDTVVVESIDFGLSKLLGENELYVEIQGAIGIPEYTAPEIGAQGKYSFASDIYALGQILDVDLDVLSTTIDLKLVALVSAMSTDKPEDRPKVKEVVEALREVVANKAERLNDPQSAMQTACESIKIYINDPDFYSTLKDNDKRRIKWLNKKLKAVPPEISQDEVEKWLMGSKLLKNCGQTLLNIKAFSEKSQENNLVLEEKHHQKPSRPAH